MRQNLIEGTYQFRINVRPVKIAYFIQDNDLHALHKVMSLSCTQWGGIRHLILPIELDTFIAPFYKALLELYDPDWFVAYWNTTKEKELSNKLQEYLQNLFPYRRINLREGQAFETHDYTIHALNIIPEEELNSNQLFKKHIEKENHQLLNLLLYGQIYPGQEEFYTENIKVVHQGIQVGSKQYWESQFALTPFSSPLNLTSYELSAYHVTKGGIFSSFDYFDIVLVESLCDMCLFWNLRASRESTLFRQEKNVIRRTICLPLELLEESQSLELLFRLCKERLFFPGRRANLDISFYCWKQETGDRLNIAISDLSIIKQFTEKKILANTIRLGPEEYLQEEQEEMGEVENRPLTYAFNQPLLPTSYREGFSGDKNQTLVHLIQGQNVVRIESMSGFSKHRRGLISIDYECDVWNRYPKNQQIAESICKNSRFSKYGISIVRDFSPGVPATFNLPEERESLQKFFRNIGVEVRSTKIEQYSNAIIDLIGGLQQVEILASKPAYTLLNILALKSSRKVAQRIVQHLGLKDKRLEEISHLFSEWEIQPELKNIPRTYTQLKDDQRIGLKNTQVLELIDKLSQVQVLKRGFYVPCPNCGTQEWYPLQIIGEYLVCLGCSFRFNLPVREPDNPNLDMQWRYRLNTLMNRVIDQDALVGVFALYHLTKGRVSSCHALGLEVWENDKCLTDLDFLFVVNQELYGGECKSGTSLGEKDFETAHLAAKLGLVEFYFCTVKNFDNDTLSKIEHLQDELVQNGSKIKIKILSEEDLLRETI